MTSGTKKDQCWQWTKPIPGETKYFLCAFCDHKNTCGIFRFKQHLVGTHIGIKASNKVPPNVKDIVTNALKKNDEERKAKLAVRREIGGLESLDEDYAHDKEVTNVVASESGGAQTPHGGGSLNQPKARGPIDKFVTTKARQVTLNTSYKKEERRDVCRAIGRLFYTSALSFNVANNPYYFAALEKVAKYGPGFEPPTNHELRTWILEEEVEDVQKLMASHKKYWSNYGCTIMSDGWMDGKSRVILIFLVNSPKGTWFLKSVDASDTIKNGELIQSYLDSVVEEVGEENVVQIITDSASNYKWAGKELMKHRSKLWWTPCAAHCIDLMLEDIAKLKVFEYTIQRAKKVVKFIYGHTQVLSIMRKFTDNKEIIRPAVTRFATSFLSLQSLYKHKDALRSMFQSNDWNECGSTKHKDAYEVKKTILRDTTFWNHVAYYIKSVMPLICVLRVVDSEVRPAMGFIYELMDVAKNKIADNFGHVEAKYMPIWRRIDSRWALQLHQPLHAAGYYLNPRFRYEEIFKDTEHVKKGLEECMDRMLVGDARIKADIQLDLYERKLGKFGSSMAECTRKIRSPVFWWEKYRTQTPELMNFATRVLSLICSALRCERNWSTFESIHTKKRNRLEHKRLHALVYVKYNIALRDRTLKRNATMIDPIVVEEIESDDEWITEKEDPVLPLDPCWLDDDMEDEAIRNVPLGTYQSSILNREQLSHASTPHESSTSHVSSPPHEPAPPSREPTLSLDESIHLYKRKSNEKENSSRRKTPKKSKALHDIIESRVNRFDETNPLLNTHHNDRGDNESDSDGGGTLSGDSLDGDLLMDEDSDFNQ